MGPALQSKTEVSGKEWGSESGVMPPSLLGTQLQATAKALVRAPCSQLFAGHLGKKKKKKEAVTLLRWLKIKFLCKKRKSRLAVHASSCGRRQQAGSAVGQGMAGRNQPVLAAHQVFSE